MVAKTHEVGVAEEGGSSLRSAVFLDRDGVINQNSDEYVKSWDEFTFLPKVFDALSLLSRHNYAVVVVSNQSAIGRGILDHWTVDSIHERMRVEIHRHNGRIDAVYYCPHTPFAGCECRKPQPGLLLQAARDLHLDLDHSYFIGDAISDLDAALSVGCSPIFVLTGRDRDWGLKLDQLGYAQISVARDLKEAVDLILNTAR